MFGTRRQVKELGAQVQLLKGLVEGLQKQLDVVDVIELERMRGSVLNALRALRRSQTAQEAAGDTNGRGARVQAQLPPLDPPGPRRNY